MTNKLKKKIGLKEIGFFLGTKSKAEFREATGAQITDIFDEGKNSDMLFANFLVACANAYEAYFGEGKKYDIDQAYQWMDEIPTDGWVEFLQELFRAPETEAVEGK